MITAAHTVIGQDPASHRIIEWYIYPRVETQWVCCSTDLGSQISYKRSSPSLILPSRTLRFATTPRTHHSSTMVNINANTPQLEAVQRWIDAYLSSDVRRIELLFSKDFKHQVFPKSTGRTEETREVYLKRITEEFPLFTSFVVRT
jgi:hypothetical protein